MNMFDNDFSHIYVFQGKCQRKEPPCKYLHPPQHLREQLLQNGRNNLILKNLQMQALAAGVQPMVPGMIQTVVSVKSKLLSLVFLALIYLSMCMCFLKVFTTNLI